MTAPKGISDRFFQSDSPLAASSEWQPLTGVRSK
jgi:hypothetical protein